MQRVMVIVVIFLAIAAQSAASPTKYYEFNITETRITRLCSTKSIITVNNQFPGPSIDVNEDDQVVITVNNFVNHNITLHWHGLLQNRTGWFDGPAYVTQCPIQHGKSFKYKLNLTGQRGTLWWHAHITFLRATVYGSMIIHPKQRFPFMNLGEEPLKEHTIVLGEWWKSDVVAVINQALATGRGTNVSDALTINGLPGPLYSNCSIKDTHVWNVLPNKRYLLRIINAAMNMELFFGIANHTLTVVEADAQYTKPLTTSSVVISPGQTLTLLLTTDQSPGRYYMASRAFASAPAGFAFDNTTTSAILNYASTEEDDVEYPSSNLPPPVLPSFLPAFSDANFVNSFTRNLRSLKRVRDEIPLPTIVDEHLFITISLNIQRCPPGINPNISCQIPVPGGGRFAASMNNISYNGPEKAFLKQHYDQMHFGARPVGYSADFPALPRPSFNFTSSPSIQNLNAEVGTRARLIRYGDVVQIVIQGTTLLAPENHPIHLHGFDFYVLAIGLGNFNSKRDSSKFNLVDPALRNTISVPAGGWAVVRFKADNPGIWAIHCHLDAHSLVGLDSVFIVKDGVGPMQSLEAPPADLPPC